MKAFNVKWNRYRAKDWCVTVIEVYMLDTQDSYAYACKRSVISTGERPIVEKFLSYRIVDIGLYM